MIAVASQSATARRNAIANQFATADQNAIANQSVIANKERGFNLNPLFLFF